MPCQNIYVPEFEWHDHSRDRDPEHAILSPSNSAWIEYDDEKMYSYLDGIDARAEGTKLHALAAELIERKILLADDGTNFNNYVNDCIAMGMKPEVKLKYSEYAFGRADAIYFDLATSTLYIFDLKTGDSGEMRQLRTYAALFCLEYDIEPSEILIELRIYKHGSIEVENAGVFEIAPIMDKIKHHTHLIRERKGNNIYVI